MTGEKEQSPDKLLRDAHWGSQTILKATAAFQGPRIVVLVYTNESLRNRKPSHSNTAVFCAIFLNHI